jgi:Arc/MetJ-type ribon-helix-helix transcriptional regulator
MKRSMSAKQKKERGRPPTGVTPMIGVRLSKSARAEIERWAKAQEDRPSLSEAIRRLIDQSLKVRR